MRNILITGIGGDVACAILRCFFDCCKEDNIYGIDIKTYTPYMDKLTKTFVAPKYTEESYMPFIKTLIQKYDITHFIPTTEPEIEIANKERDYFRNNNIKLLINNETIVDICMSKYKTFSFLREHGIDVPDTYYAEKFNGELEYPFIMKSDKGCGSKHLKVVKNAKDWEEADKKGMVCQQLIGSDNTEYTIGVFSDSETISSITLKRQLGYGGLSAMVQCCDIPQTKDIAQKIAEAFHLKGAFNIQLRKEGNKFFVFEINPRLSSTTGFRHMFGFMDAVWWIDMIDGMHIPQFEKKSVGMRGMKVLDDLIIKESAICNWKDIMDNDHI